MQEPTYTFEEMLFIIECMDMESIIVLQDLLNEESLQYPVLEYGKLYKAINLKKEKLNFEDRNKK